MTLFSDFVDEQKVRNKSIYLKTELFRNILNVFTVTFD